MGSADWIDPDVFAGGRDTTWPDATRERCGKDYALPKPGHTVNPMPTNGRKYERGDSRRQRDKGKGASTLNIDLVEVLLYINPKQAEGVPNERGWFPMGCLSVAPISR